ncbi:MAG: polysaccharide deacetylase family protein [Candidatus Korarchaeota archaeon]|nr:polysaccharide deacetylase family protein [Candidatus Korarchaeota archaeon]NIU83916.1 polysaccharide deacetylase family protein [Candidatus Thorarchaeota archaeon]NIW14206.1 polysaccharide deacetylase family protein [Candidatus Thorarchaeota archaeon]NIW52305.1 polysaccharide deacetylase family protein [Candidatus Korarchaeota archaeon]
MNIAESDAIFTLSLDLELIFAVQEKNEEETDKFRKRILSNIRKRIQELLILLEEYQVKATWAVCGHLFLDRCTGGHGIGENEWLKRDPASSIDADPLWYGRDIVKGIIHNRIDHEIASHGFSHIPFSHIREEMAFKEVRTSLRAARELGIAVESFIYPRNEVAHLKVLKECGIKCYRIVPRKRELGLLPTKFLRSIDYFFGLRHSSPIKPKKDVFGLLQIPASDALYRSATAMHLARLPPRNNLLWKWKEGVKETVKKGGIFHVWMHPHDFKTRVTREELTKFFKLVKDYKMQGKLKNLTMKEIALQWRNS